MRPPSIWVLSRNTRYVKLAAHNITGCCGSGRDFYKSCCRFSLRSQGLPPVPRFIFACKENSFLHFSCCSLPQKSCKQSVAILWTLQKGGLLVEGAAAHFLCRLLQKMHRGAGSGFINFMGCKSRFFIFAALLGVSVNSVFYICTHCRPFALKAFFEKKLHFFTLLPPFSNFFKFLSVSFNFRPAVKIKTTYPILWRLWVWSCGGCTPSPLSGCGSSLLYGSENSVYYACKK